MSNNNTTTIPKFATIPEVAQYGIMSAASLRILDKCGLLPGFHVGRKTMVDFDQLCENLKTPEYQSKVNEVLQAAKSFR